MCLSKIVREELIGLRFRVLKSSCKTYECIDGIIIDETKNTFVIKDNKEKKKIIPKKNILFEFTLRDNTIVKINGDKLIHRPESRIKKLWKYI